MENLTDEKVEQVSTSAGSVAEEEPSTSKAEEKSVPYSRFREVNEKMRSLEAEIKELKSQKSETGLTPEQAAELQAKQYLKNLLKETLAEEERARIEAEKREAEQFEKEVDEVLSLHTDVKKEDFLKFIEEKSEVYGIQSIAGAMRLYKDLQNVAKDASDKTKRSLASKPSLPSNEGFGKEAPYHQTEEFRHKSLREIAEDTIRQLSKK